MTDSTPKKSVAAAGSCSECVSLSDPEHSVRFVRGMVCRAGYSSGERVRAEATEAVPTQTARRAIYT